MTAMEILRDDQLIKMVPLTDEQKVWLEDYNRREEIKSEYKRLRIKAILRVPKIIFFSPLAIACRVMCVASRIVGTVSAIGLPYGAYCVYKVAAQMIEGAALFETTHFYQLCIFFVLPFVAFFFFWLFQTLYSFFRENSR